MGKNYFEINSRSLQGVQGVGLQVRYLPVPVVYISICMPVDVMFEYQCFAAGHFLTYYQCNWFPPSVNSFVTGLKSSQMTPISYILSIQSTRASIIHYLDWRRSRSQININNSALCLGGLSQHPPPFLDSGRRFKSPIDKVGLREKDFTCSTH